MELPNSKKDFRNLIDLMKGISEGNFSLVEYENSCRKFVSEYVRYHEEIHGKIGNCVRKNIVRKNLKTFLPLFFPGKEYTLSKENTEKLLLSAKRLYKEISPNSRVNFILKNICKEILSKKNIEEFPGNLLAKIIYESLFLSAKKDSFLYPYHVHYYYGKISRLVSITIYLYDGSCIDFSKAMEFFSEIIRRLEISSLENYFRLYVTWRFSKDSNFCFSINYPFPYSENVSLERKKHMKKILNCPFVEIFRYPNFSLNLEDLYIDNFTLVYDNSSARFLNMKTLVDCSVEEYSRKLYYLLFPRYSISLPGMRKYFASLVTRNLELAIYSKMLEL